MVLSRTEEGNTDTDMNLDDATTNSVDTSKTSNTMRTEGSLARERKHAADRAQFNTALSNIKERNDREQEKFLKEKEEAAKLIASLQQQLRLRNSNQEEAAQDNADEGGDPDNDDDGDGEDGKEEEDDRDDDEPAPDYDSDGNEIQPDEPEDDDDDDDDCPPSYDSDGKKHSTRRT